jgi:hypothetical protein
MSSVAEAIINLYKTTPQLWIYTPNNNEYTYFNGDVLLAIGIKKLVGVDDFMELKVFFKPSGERSNIAEISTTDETKRTIFEMP